MKLRRGFVNGLINAPGEIVQRQIILRVTDFHVEMRSRRRTGVAHLAHDVTLPDRELVGSESQVDAEAFLRILFFLHTARNGFAEAKHVAVHRSRPVGMCDVQTISISPRRDAHTGDIAAFDGMDRITDLAADAPVQPTVKMIVPQFAVVPGKRHGHIERPDGLLLCPRNHAPHQCDSQCQKPLHDFGVKLEELRQLSTISFSFRSSRFGT